MTSIKRLIDKLLDNWIAKVVSLFIAILLYVFYQASLIDKKTFVIPLKIVEDGIVMHVGKVQNYVPVVIRTNDTIMNMINPSDFEGIVDISYLTEAGNYTLPIKISLSPKLMELDPLEVILKEQNLNIQVDKRISKYVPLEPTIVGEVAHGYAISQISLSPSTVKITGPQSIINAIESIPTGRIMVSNAENNFSVETSCQEQSNLISIFEEGPIYATVSLSTEVMEREFTDVPVEYFALPSNLQIKGELPSVSFVLSGDVPLLENYSLSGRVAYVNLHECQEPGQYELPLRLNLAASFSVVSKSTETISLTVEEITENADEDEGLEEGVSEGVEAGQNQQAENVNSSVTGTVAGNE